MSPRTHTDMALEEEKSPYPLFDHPILKAAASLKGGRIKIEAKGLLSAMPKVRSSLEMIDGQIPALASEKLCISTWMPPAPSLALHRLAASSMKAALGRRIPDQVTISITEECPNRCIHCALPDSGRHLRLEPETIKDVITQILELGTTLVIFDGGEPATYQELPEVVSAVDDRAISTLFTSGAGFSPALARRLKAAGLYAVNISLDSPVEKEHDIMRGRQGVFNDAMQAIKNAKEAGLLVDLYVVLRRENIHHLQEFHHLAKMKGVHELTFFEVVPVGRYLGRSDAALSPQDYSALDKFVSHSGWPKIFSVPAALSRLGCFAGRNWMHIAPDGEVYPCACMPHSMGSIFHEPVSRIWRRMAGLPTRGSKICPMRGNV